MNRNKLKTIPFKVILITFIMTGLFLFYYSTINIKLTKFEINNLDKDNDGYYIVDVGQEIEIIVTAESRAGLIIDSLFINEEKYINEHLINFKSDESNYFYYQGDPYKNKIRLTYIVEENESLLILKDVKIRSGRFFLLGNKFKLNNLETIKIKTRD